MLTLKIGDSVLRITPPSDGRAGYSAVGTVANVNEDTVDVIVQVDMPRCMQFRRSDGCDVAGRGWFIVRPRSLD